MVVGGRRNALRADGKTISKMNVKQVIQAEAAANALVLDIRAAHAEAVDFPEPLLAHVLLVELNAAVALRDRISNIRRAVDEHCENQSLKR